MKLSPLKQALLARLKMSLLKLARLGLSPLKLSLLARLKQRLLRQSGSGEASPKSMQALPKRSRMKLALLALLKLSMLK